MELRISPSLPLRENEMKSRPTWLDNAWSLVQQGLYILFITADSLLWLLDMVYLWSNWAFHFIEAGLSSVKLGVHVWHQASYSSSHHRSFGGGYGYGPATPLWDQWGWSPFPLTVRGAVWSNSSWVFCLKSTWNAISRISDFCILMHFQQKQDM